MDDSVELRLIGITYNQIENGVYALILEDPADGRRLAIVIGYPEAQSIECHLQSVKTPRPLAHDLLASMLTALDAKLLRVDIHRLPSGPYAGKLTVRNLYGETVELDARSSDAIALAIRVGAPIFTSRRLLEKKGYVPAPSSRPRQARTVDSSNQSPASGSQKWDKYSDDQLREMLDRYVSEENYEGAADVKRELERRHPESPAATQ